MFKKSYFKYKKLSWDSSHVVRRVDIGGWQWKWCAERHVNHRGEEKKSIGKKLQKCYVKVKRWKKIYFKESENSFLRQI
jgi:hypothetical protein